MERVETYYMKTIDNQGSTIEEHSYNPWGNHRNSNNWTLSNFSSSLGINRGFTGHEMLPQFQLINMNGRMYDPIICRMLSPDNFVQDETNAQNYNRYSYCLNNPLKYTEPSGWFIDDYFDKNGKFLYRDNKDTDYIWIVEGEVDALTGGDEIYNREDYFIKTRLEDTKLSKDAMLNIVNFYDKELGTVEGKDAKVTLDVQPMKPYILMQQETSVSRYLFNWEFWKGSENIFTNNFGNIFNKDLNTASNIKNTLVHEYKHVIDRRKGYSEERTLELRAIDAQKKHPTYENTTENYRNIIRNNENYYKNIR